MISTIFFSTLIVLSLHIVGAAEPRCGDHSGPDLPGVTTGEIGVAESEFPFLANLLAAPDYDDSICTGVVVDKDKILTTAQCVLDHRISQGGQIAVAEYNQKLDDSSGSIIKELYIHKGYSNHSLKNDLGIIIVKRPIRFVAWQGVVLINRPCLPSGKEITPDGMNFIIVGWRGANYFGPAIPTPRASQLIKLPSSTCQKWYGSVSEKEQICVQGHSSRCHLELGTPIVQYRGRDQYLIGLMTATTSSCGSDSPSLVTKVSGHLDFIQNPIDNGVRVKWGNIGPYPGH